MRLRGRWRSSSEPEAWRPLEAVCPFLGLNADARMAFDVPDRDHRCHAVEPRAGLSRRDQTRLCLTGRHRSCPRYLARVGAHHVTARGVGRTGTGGGAAALGAYATRLVATPETVPPWARAGVAARPLAVAASAVVSLVLIVSLAAIGANWADDPDRSPPSGGRELGRVVPAASRAAEPTEVATPEPTPPAATPQPTPSAVPTPPPATPAPVVPEPRVYVVQPGDTLIGIAGRFGTTADAIMAYNGLQSDMILIDQVLLIP